MQSAKSVIASLRQGEYLASVDIQDAYLHSLIYPPHQGFLCFAVGDNRFQYFTLHFCLSSAPRVFTKILACLLAFLRTQSFQFTGNLEDLLLGTPLPSTCKHPQDNWDVPGVVLGILEYVGLILDTFQVFLPQKKILSQILSLEIALR